MYDLEALEPRIMLSTEGADALGLGVGGLAQELAREADADPAGEQLPLTGSDLADLYDPSAGADDLLQNDGTDDFFAPAPAIEPPAEPTSDPLNDTQEELIPAPPVMDFAALLAEDNDADSGLDVAEPAPETAEDSAGTSGDAGQEFSLAGYEGFVFDGHLLVFSEPGNPTAHSGADEQFSATDEMIIMLHAPNGPPAEDGISEENSENSAISGVGSNQEGGFDEPAFSVFMSGGEMMPMSGPSLGGLPADVVYWGRFDTSLPTVVLAPSLSLTSSTTFASASVTITNGVAGDVLAVANTHGLTVSFNSGTRVLSISGTASAATYQSVLRQVAFSSSSNAVTARNVSFSITETPPAEGSPGSASGGTVVRIAHLDGGLTGALVKFGEVMEELAGYFMNTAIFGVPLYNVNTVPQAVREDLSIIPYVQNTIRDLVFPQTFNDSGDQVNDFAKTLQPWQVAHFLRLETVMENFTNTNNYLTGLATALTNFFNAVANDPFVGIPMAQRDFTVTVDWAGGNNAFMEINVHLIGSKPFGSFSLELGTLREDLGLALIETPSFGAGGGIELDFRFRVNLSGHRFNNAAIGDNQTVLEFNELRGTAGFQFDNQNRGIEVGMARGMTQGMSGRFFAEIPMTYSSGSTGTLNWWAPARFSGFVKGGGEAELTIPIVASVFGQPITTSAAPAVVHVFEEDIFDSATPPVYTTTNYEALYAFSVVTPEEVIQSILDVGDIYRLLEVSGEELLGIPLPFLQDLNIGELFAWSDLFHLEIGSGIDVNEILLVTAGTDGMVDIRLDPNFVATWLFPALFPAVSTDALLRNQMQFALILNEDLDTYQEVTIAESSARNTLDDLVADINTALNALGGLYTSVQAQNIAETLAFFAPANSGIDNLHLVPHRLATADMTKFALVQSSDGLTFQNRPSGNAYMATFALKLPLVFMAEIAVDVDGTTHNIVLNSVPGETYAAFVARMQAALNSAFGAGTISVELVDEDGVILNNPADADSTPGLYYLRLAGEDGTLTLDVISEELAAAVIPLGFLVGDQAARPRPFSLRTFDDFNDGSIVGRTPDSVHYDPVGNVISLGYRVLPTTGPATEALVNVGYNFPSVSLVTPSGTVMVTITSEMGLGFVLDFILGPERGPTFNSSVFGDSDSVVLAEDATFEIDFVLGHRYEITVSAASTTGNQTLQDMVGDVNAALASAVRVSDPGNPVINLTENTFIAWNDAGRIQLTNAFRVQTAPYALSHTNGVLATDQVFSFSYEGEDYLLLVPAVLTTDFENEGDLLNLINSLMGTVFVDINQDGVVDPAAPVVSLSGLVFATTISTNENAFYLYATGPPLADWPFTTNIFAPQGGAFVTGLRFSGGAEVAGNRVRLTAQAEESSPRLRSFDGSAPLAQGQFSYQIPSFSGTARFGFNQVNFGAVEADLLNVAITIDADGSHSVRDIFSLPAATLDVDIDPDQPGITLSLRNLTAPDATIQPTARFDIIIDDFKATNIEAFVPTGLPVPIFSLERVGGELTGRLTDDATLSFFFQGTKYSVTVTQAEAAGNASYDQLVAQFNSKLETALMDDALTVDISESFQFAGNGDTLIVQVLTRVRNPDYVRLEVLPDLAAFGSLGAQSGFSTQAVVDALFDALLLFEDIFADPDGVFSMPLPIINTAMNAFWHLPGDMAARINALQNNPATSASQLPARIGAAFGMPASSVRVEWDDANSAYRIELQFISGTIASRPIDVNPASFANFAEGDTGGLNRLIDGANRSPATFQGFVTFNIALGIDLSDPANPRYFLYEYDANEDEGTSIEVDFMIYAEGIEFTSSKRALGLFIRDGVAILAGETMEHVSGQVAYINPENQNRTPYLLHLVESDFANITLTLSSGDMDGHGKYYLGNAPAGGHEIELDDFARDITGSVQLILPIYTPTETMNPFTNRTVDGILLVDPDTMTGQLNATGTVGGNVFELRIFDYGQYVEDVLAWPSLTGAERGAVKGSGNVEIYVPDPESDAGIETPTLLDLLRDPALLLDGIDFFFGIIQAGLAGLGSLPIPIIGPAFASAANSVFSFRDNWLRETRNKLRGAGESFGELLKEVMFDVLGPEGVGILLQINGIAGLDGQVQAGGPDDIIFDFVDELGNPITGMGGYGAHGLEFQIRLGSLLLDTGFTTELNFDVLEPVFSIGMDGGFGFSVGWDLQIGFGFNLSDGFYIKVDGDRSELEMRVEADLLGAQEHFEVRARAGSGTGYSIWDRRSNTWVEGPRKGDGSTEIINVINVTESAGDWVAYSGDWNDNLWAGGSLTGGSGSHCGCGSGGGGITIDEPDNFWVVAAFDSDTNQWVAAYMDKLGQYRPQTGGWDADLMVEYNRTAPFTAFGSLFFLNLEATDMVKVGLDPAGDADYAFGFTESQLTPNERNDDDDGVRRNNHLPTRAFASIGINLWDPSEKAEDNDILPVFADGHPTNWAVIDWNGEFITDIGLPFVPTNEDGVPAVNFGQINDKDNGDFWFVVNLVDEDNADDIRDFFLDQLAENEWKMQIERRFSYGSPLIVREIISFDGDDWVYLDSGDEWQPLFDEDWTFIIRVPNEFDSSQMDVVRVKFIQLGDDYYDILENGTGWYIIDPNYAGVEGGAAFDGTNGLLQPIALFDEIEDDWEVPLFMLLSTDVSLSDLAGDGRLKADNFDEDIPVGVMNFDDFVRWGYLLPMLPFDADLSENSITFAELREYANDIVQLRLVTSVIVNLGLELSVSDNAAFPRITAELNLDWGLEVNLFDDDPFKDVVWVPHLGLNNIRLDVGSFLTDYLRPVLEKIDEGLEPVRPLIKVLTDPIPVISDIAGRDISLSNILYQFGGPKGQAIATFIDVVRLVSDLSAMVASLPDDMNVYLPIGNIWLARRGGELGDTIFYDNNELTPPSFTQQNQALIGADGVANAAQALGELNDADKNNQPNQGITNNSKKGGFGFPILSDPSQVFNLLMGRDAVLVTYSVPTLEFTFDKRIPLVQLGPFQAGIRFGFEVTAQLHFGFDTYGVRRVFDTGNPLWAIDGFYISDRENPDGTGRDIPELTMSATIALYGGVDIFLARGGIEGGFKVTLDVDLNDPNEDGKIRPSELAAIVMWTNNPLDWFNIRLQGEVYARFYYKVMIPIPYPFGIKRVTILEGGKTFARLTLFDLERRGSKGPPILGEKIDFITPDGEVVSNALLIHMGPNAEARITNDDPFYDSREEAILDGSERFVITNSGSSVTVTLYNRPGTTPFHSMTFNNVSMVVAYAGEGDDRIDASGLNGLRVYFEGMEGNNQITVGTTHANQASWVIGGVDNDTLTIGGGYVYIDGVAGNNTITLGSGATATNVYTAGLDRDTVSGGGNGARNTVQFGYRYGDINLSGLDRAQPSLSTVLDFSATFLPLLGELGSANSVIRAGGSSRVTFHLAAITEFRGSQNRDELTFTAPQTHPNGLSLRGGLGNDVFTFIGSDFSGVTAPGITIDDDLLPTVAATIDMGGIVFDDCGGIAEIPLIGSGSGYVTAPEVIITHPNGVQARAVAGLGLDGRLTGIVTTNRGFGYDAAGLTIELVNRQSFNDTVRFILADDAALTQAVSLTRVGANNVITYEGKVIRIAENIENITIEAPGAVVDTGLNHVQLEGRLRIRAEQFVHQGPITADTIVFVTDQGYSVDYPIATTNNGSILLEVLGRGQVADVLPVIQGGVVTGFTVNGAASGTYYNFNPQVSVFGTSESERALATLMVQSGSLQQADGQVVSVITRGGLQYSNAPLPTAHVTPPGSILLNASVSTSAVGSVANTGDGRGTITLRALQGGVITTAKTEFQPTDWGSDIIWRNGDFWYTGLGRLEQIQSGGQGATAEAVIDGDGRLTEIIVTSGGSGYTLDYLPSVIIPGPATATPIISGGVVTGFNITNPGGGYAVAPSVTIQSNGLSKLVPTQGVNPSIQTQHIKAANGFLVIDTLTAAGHSERPLLTDVRVFVAQTSDTGNSGIHILENDGFYIGLVDGINGVTSGDSDITLANFSGTVFIGMPVQRTTSHGELLWQDEAKTIPIYETYQEDVIINGRLFRIGDIVYTGGRMNSGAGNIIIVADNVDVQSFFNSNGADSLSIRPVSPEAVMGLAGSRARAEAVVENGQIVDIIVEWQGRGYGDNFDNDNPPLVLINAPGDRAFGVATVLGGQVSSLEVTFGGSRYTSAPIVNLIGGGGTGATAEAIVVDGQVIGLNILNPGSGYTSSPRVDIALPGQQAMGVAVLNSIGRVESITITNPGSNYTFVPRVTIEQPFPFGLDQEEVDFFQSGFNNFQLGRFDGNHRVVTADPFYQDNTVLVGDKLFFEHVLVNGSLTVYGSPNTATYEPGGDTTANEIIVNSGMQIGTNPVAGAVQSDPYLFIATDGGITFQNTGVFRGAELPAPDNGSIILDATGTINLTGSIGTAARPLHNVTITTTPGHNINFGGEVHLTGTLTITQGAVVTFNNAVNIEGDLVIGDPNNLAAVSSVVFTSNATLDVAGNIHIYASGAINFRADVGEETPSTDMDVISGASIIVQERLTGNTIHIQAGPNNDLTFGQLVRGNDMHFVAGRLTRVESAVRVDTGNLTFTTNRIELLGSSGSIINDGPASVLTIKPFTVSRDIAVGEPIVFFGLDENRLSITYREIRAIGGGFEEVFWGDVNDGSGRVFVSELGLTENNLFFGPPSIINPTTIVGGMVQVGYNDDLTFFSGIYNMPFGSQINVNNAADFLRFKSLTGDVRIDAAINSNNEINSWIRIEAEQNIIINRPIFASERISLTAGYDGGNGGVAVNSTGDNTGHLFTMNASVDTTIEISAGTDSGNIVFTDQVFDATDAQPAITVWAVGAAGEILMQAPGGSITQNDGLLRSHLLAATSADDITLDLTDIDRIGAGTIDGITLGIGDGSIDSGVDVFIDGIVITGAGNLWMLETDELTIDNILTAGGDITISNLEDSEGDINLGTLNATSGDITLTADGAITDDRAGDIGGADNIINLTTTGHVSLTAKTGIGGPGDDDIDTNIGSLEAVVTVSGGIYIDEINGLVIAGPVSSANNGPILISLADGNLSVASNVTANGSGNILLEALNGSVTIDAAVTSTTGHITIFAEEDVTLDEDANISTSAPGTISITAATGDLDMDGEATVMAMNSSIRLVADGDIYLGNVSAGATGRVSVVSESFSIFNATGSTLNVFAQDLRMEADRAIGTPTNPLTLSVDNLAAFANSDHASFKGVYLNQNRDVLITEVAPVTVQIVDSSNDLTPSADTLALNDLATDNDGDVVLVATGTVTVDEDTEISADGEGNVRLQATGVNHDVILNGSVTSDTGHITIMANRNIVLDEDVVIETAMPGTVYIRAENGFVDMDADAEMTALNSSLYIHAELNVVLGQVVATNVAVTSDARSIYTADEDIAINITATNLRLEADRAIGEFDPITDTVIPVTIAVTTLSALARSNDTDEKGVFLQNVDTDVTVGSVAVTVQEYNASATTTARTAAAQADLTTLNDGPIGLVNEEGSITLTDGNGNEVAVSADGEGFIIIHAMGADADLVAEANASVVSGTGDVWLSAGRDVDLTGTVSVSTGGDGEILVVAENGDILMNDGAEVVSENGNIRLDAQNDIYLSLVESDDGDITIYSHDGAIIDNTADEEPNLITDGHLILRAATGIGNVNAADINTNVAFLTALNTTSGLIVIQEESDVEIIVPDDADTTEFENVGIHNLADDGSVIVTTIDGTMTVSGPVFAADGGHILLQVDGVDQDLAIESTVTTEDGSITLQALGNGGDIRVEAAVRAQGDGNILMMAVGGSVLFNADGRAITDNRNIGIAADQDVSITGVNAGTADVTILAVDGEISDAGDQVRDIVANRLKLQAETSIGSGDALDTNVDRLAARAETGEINISNLGNLLIELVSIIAFNQVLPNNTLLLIDDQSALNNVVADTNITLVSENGSITIRDPFTTDNAILSESGNITITAETNVLQNANIRTNSGESIDVTAVDGDIVMAYDGPSSTGTLTSGPDADITYTADGDIFLSTIQTMNGDVTVDAGDRIVDNRSGDENPNIITPNLATLLAVNGIGDVNDADIDLNVGTVTATNTTSGRIVLDEVNGLIIGGDGIATLGGNGDIIVTVNLGNLDVEEPVSAHGSGNIRVDVVAGALDVDAAIESGTGHITLLANGDMDFSANSDIETGGVGTVYVATATGSITMADGATAGAGANLRFLATDNIVLGGLTATQIYLNAGGSILTAGTAHVDITASAAQLVSDGYVGMPGGDYLITSIGTLAIEAVDGVYVSNTTALTIGSVAAIDVELVAMDSTTATQSGSPLAGIVSDGPVKIEASTITAGSLTISENIDVDAGDVLLAARNGGLILHAAIDAVGHISLLATANITFAATSNVTTEGTVDVEAAGGLINMLDGALIETNEAVRLYANVNIVLGGIVTQGNVSLIAVTGSISDGGGTHVDVVATQLRMVAGIGIGTASNPINTDVETLSARATSGGVFIENVTDVVVGNTSATVNRVQMNSTTVMITDAVQSDIITTSGNGSIVLTTLNGSITLNDGTAPQNGSAISAHGSGSITIEAGGNGSEVIVNADVVSGSGPISIQGGPGGDVILAIPSDIVTSGPVYVEFGSAQVYEAQWGWSNFIPLAGDFNADGRTDYAVYDPVAATWFIQTVDRQLIAWNFQWGWSDAQPIVGDFNGDGADDIGVYHAATGRWYVYSLHSNETVLWDVQWGYRSAVPVVGDFNGDGRADLAVYDQFTGRWFIRTVGGDLLAWNEHWGFEGMVPVAADFNNDGRTDLAVYDLATGLWYVRSLDGPTIIWAEQWGYAGVIPMAADFDGDGFADLAVFDTETGIWHIRYSSGGSASVEWDWGWGVGVPLVGDYNGNGHADLAIYDPTEGMWHVRLNQNSTLDMRSAGWQESIPVPGDFDGDGIADVAVYRPDTGTWYIEFSSGGSQVVSWGGGHFIPVPGDYDGDGRDDLAVFDPDTGNWYILSLTQGVLAWSVNWGFAGTIPVAGDYSGNGRSDLGIYDPVTQTWFIRELNGPTLAWNAQWGFAGTVPVSGDFNGDGRHDLAIYDPASGAWFVRMIDGPSIAWNTVWTAADAQPLSGAFQLAGRSDFAFYQPESRFWFVRTVAGTTLFNNFRWGYLDALPGLADFDGDGLTDLTVYHPGSGNWHIRLSTGGERWVVQRY